MSTIANDAVSPPEEVYDLLSRTNKQKPARKDVEALRKALHEYPGLWRKYGDLARLTQHQIIAKSEATQAVSESLNRGVSEMREEMGFQTASPLERLLIEQVVLTWLHFYKTQYSYDEHLRLSLPTKHRDFWDRHLNAAQRRFLRSLETLARVRKMSRRGQIQINVAEQQVNVAA